MARFRQGLRRCERGCAGVPARVALLEWPTRRAARRRHRMGTERWDRATAPGDRPAGLTLGDRLTRGHPAPDFVASGPVRIAPPRTTLIVAQQRRHHTDRRRP